MLTTNPRLDTIPDASHCSSIEDRPHWAPYSEWRPANNRKTDMVCGADAASHADESTGESIANPYTKPWLPPRQSSIDHRRRYHPGILSVADQQVSKIFAPTIHARCWMSLQSRNQQSSMVPIDGAQVRLPKYSVQYIIMISTRLVWQILQTWFQVIICQHELRSSQTRFAGHSQCAQKSPVHDGRDDGFDRGTMQSPRLLLFAALLSLWKMTKIKAPAHESY